MTSGIKTSEFWLSIVALGYNAILGLGIIPHSDEISAAVNGIAALLVALGYTWARTFLKNAGTSNVSNDSVEKNE